MMRITSLFLVSLLLLAGSESPDRLLTNAERVLGSRTGRTVLDIASGKDPKHILKDASMPISATQRPYSGICGRSNEISTLLWQR
jgi:hypothetical protein